ncbi:hypothetical protein ACHAW6_008428 [Cyclotella cf. meneghiniana]
MFCRRYSLSPFSLLAHLISPSCSEIAHTTCSFWVNVNTLQNFSWDSSLASPHTAPVLNALPRKWGKRVFLFDIIQLRRRLLAIRTVNMIHKPKPTVVMRSVFPKRFSFADCGRFELPPSIEAFC